MKICYLVLLLVASIVSATVWSSPVHAANRKKTNITPVRHSMVKPAPSTRVAVTQPAPQTTSQIVYSVPGTVCYLPGANGNSWGTSAGAGSDNTGRYPPVPPVQSQTMQTPQTGSVATQPMCFYYPNTVCYNPAPQCWTQWGVPAAAGSAASNQPVQQGTQNSTWNQPAQAASAPSGNNVVYYSACVPAWNVWY
ncbi:hypothetical protein [Desulfomonile tiedjei]|uniref:Uncharacterized protein n=1 Tax=Desulfomonile tiedjei (strain ATCC 49306 / DSM 6799 / DCB-1) TaxID=706587 RepID=I4CCC8_DESTA|nr:hypothetical protein [Desulfomonile tiedjei]AFM27219.1 hypothetical protein Desti_4593 [Desulfomonile tiedjei DSM 6799]